MMIEVLLLRDLDMKEVRRGQLFVLAIMSSIALLACTALEFI
jgi:hypothetical protein